MRRLKILTWHTHGSYLHYLTQAPHDFYVLSRPERPPGYTGRSGHLPWGPNVHDLPVAEARAQSLDCILFQDDHQYLRDRYEYLTDAQQRLPRIYLEHDPPRGSPTDERHPVDDPGMLLVHVTPYNALMWDSGRTPTRVIEHGVIAPDGVRYRGELPRGLVIVNHLGRRGRRLGADVFEAVRRRVPLDLVGMASEECGGLGEIRHAELGAFAAQYRFLFNPIRHTSLGLAVLEAMMDGLPVVALATTEMATVVQNGVNGYADTRIDTLVEHMNRLLSDPEHAQRLSCGARAVAARRFNIERFVREWDAAFRSVVRG